MQEALLLFSANRAELSWSSAGGDPPLLREDVVDLRIVVDMRRATEQSHCWSSAGRYPPLLHDDVVDLRIVVDLRRAVEQSNAGALQEPISSSPRRRR